MSQPIRVASPHVKYTGEAIEAEYVYRTNFVENTCIGYQVISLFSIC